MATKAERFRYESERSRPPAAKAKKIRKRKAGVASVQGPPLGRKAMFALEETPPAVTPSRKSTRKSKHRQKAATSLTGRNMLAKTSPQARHDVGPPSLRAPR